MARKIGSSGTSYYALWCKDCERWVESPPRWIKHAIIERALERQGIKVENIYVVGDDSHSTPCIICGAPGEWHHWAPQALSHHLGEWPHWPCAYLCRHHHLQWHKAVTPALVFGGQL